MIDKCNPKSSGPEDDLLAVMDRFTAAARLHEHLPKPVLASPTRGQAITPDAILSGRRLEVTRENPNPADIQATATLLATYRQAEAWRCPRCQQDFVDAEAFIHHLTGEINDAMTSFASHYAQPISPLLRSHLTKAKKT